MRWRVRESVLCQGKGCSNVYDSLWQLLVEMASWHKFDQRGIRWMLAWHSLLTYQSINELHLLLRYKESMGIKVRLYTLSVFILHLAVSYQPQMKFDRQGWRERKDI